MDHMVLNADRGAPDEDAQWDPLAPAHYRDAVPEVIIEEVAPAPADAPHMEEDGGAAETGDGGYADGLGIARVWMEDGKLTRVRISRNWRTKLESEEVSLADCINAAIMLASLEVEHTVDPGIDEVPESELVPITSRKHGEELFEDLMRRREDALVRFEEAENREPPQTRAHAQGTTAVLDQFGRLMRVEFAESWLARSEPTTINNSVVAAARKAYREYVPTTQPVRQELDQLAREHNVLHASYLAWMNRGDWQ